MKAVRVLSENIQALLRARHQSQHDLAQWCRHSDPWLSAFISGKREIQLADLDRIADFFGIATYQLFQPGISQLTERRTHQDRRSGRDRRISHAQRQMVAVQAEMDRLHPRRRVSRIAKKAASSGKDQS